MDDSSADDIVPHPHVRWLRQGSVIVVLITIALAWVMYDLLVPWLTIQRMQHRVSEEVRPGMAWEIAKSKMQTYGYLTAYMNKCVAPVTSDLHIIYTARESRILETYMQIWMHYQRDNINLPYLGFNVCVHVEVDTSGTVVRTE